MLPGGFQTQFAVHGQSRETAAIVLLASASVSSSQAEGELIRISSNG